MFGLEFDLFWYKDGILIDVCFGEPPWRFDGLSLTLRLFRDTLIIVPEDLGWSWSFDRESYFVVYWVGFLGISFFPSPFGYLLNVQLCVVSWDHFLDFPVGFWCLALLVRLWSWLRFRWLSRLPGALLPYVCASNFPLVICWEYMLSVEEVDLQYKEIFVLLDWDALGSENSLEFRGHQGWGHSVLGLFKHSPGLQGGTLEFSFLGVV